jgi:hypothetical protein
VEESNEATSRGYVLQIPNKKRQRFRYLLEAGFYFGAATALAFGAFCMAIHVILGNLTWQTMASFIG